MTRLELYHNKQTTVSWKGPIFFIFICTVLIIGFFAIRQYLQSTIKIEEPVPDMGQKVVVHLPNGQNVYTYENLIFEKNGKTYYRGERNTINLSGGTVTYENWK